MIRTIYPPVFISYSPEDSELAFDLCRRLQGAGIESWYDNIRLESDCDWYSYIAAAADSARIVLPVLTPNWQDFSWTRYETYAAEHIIPLVFEGEPGDVAPIPLRALNPIDLRTSDYPAWQQLFDRIKSYLEQRTPSKTRRLIGRPYARYSHCDGRVDLLLEMFERLHRPEEDGTRPHVLALTGANGAGKSAVAREYTQHFRKVYKNILRVRADSYLPLEFARLAGEMGLVLEPSEEAVEDANLAKRELCSSTPRLLILDNVSDEEDIRKWLPTGGGCRTIIVSRGTVWLSDIQTLNVEVLEPESARSLLLSSPNLPDTEENAAAADEVARELQYLPISLQQARGYVEQVGTTYQNYLDVYTAARTHLADHSLNGAAYPESVAAAWLTTIGKISSLGRSVLSLSAFMGSAPVPRSLLAAAIPVLKAANKELEEVTLAELEKALIELSDYSLIRLTSDMFSIHSLGRAVQRDYFVSDDLRRLWTEGSVILLSTVFPFDDPEQAYRCEELLPHARAASEWIAIHSLKNSASMRLLSSMGVYLSSRGLYNEAEAPLRRALSMSEQLLGPEHLRTADALSNLALLYRKQRNKPDAESLFIRSLDIYEKNSGSEHPRVATALMNIGLLYKSKRRYHDAEPLFVRALDIREKAFGAEHLETAIAIYNLAGLYCFMGKNARAEPLYKKALKIREKALGPEHPDTVDTLNDLANLQFVLGKFAEAEPLCLNALRIREKVFGLKHPRTAETIHSLAGVYYSQKNYGEAQTLYSRALEIRQRMLDPLHPDIADTLNNMASLHYSLGNFAQAEPFYRRALEIYKQTLGEDHVSTQRVRKNLNHLQKKMPRSKAAGEPVAA